MKKPLNQLAASCSLLLIAACLLGAEPLRDPTRPPDVHTTGVAADVSSGGSGSFVASYINSANKTAIIDGQIVTLGDKIGEFTITGITPYTVVLTGADNTEQTLELVPQIKSVTKAQGSE